MRRFFIGFAFALGLTGASGCAVSTQQEVQMGADYASQINQQLPIVSDPEANRYINVLGNEIAAKSDTRGLEWHFFIVNSPEVNAFAVPGGYIYINRGLVERARTLSMLAGPLAHEIAHVTQRHSIKQMQKAQGANFGLTVGCVLMPAVCGNQAGQAAINVGANAAFAKFSRSDEAQADAKGIEYVTRAGIDPRGMTQMFEVLLEERQRRPTAVDAWFATHPMEESRIAATQKETAKIPRAVLQSLTSDTRNFQAFKSRLQSLPAAQQARR